jgi:hypothetical protein
MQELVQRLRKVASGIGLVYAGLCLWVLSIVIAIVTPFFVLADIGLQVRPNKNRPAAVGKPNPGAPGAKPAAAVNAIQGPARVVLIGGMLVGLTSWLFDLFGKLKCLAVPPECQGASYLTVSAGFAVLLAIVQIWSLLGVFSLIVEPPLILTPVIIVLGLVANILFMIFLQLLAEYIHRPDLAAAARSIFFLVIAMSVCALGVLVMLLLTMISPLFGMLGLLGLCVLFIMAIVWLVRYGGLLPNLQTALQAYADALHQDQLKFKAAPRE